MQSLFLLVLILLIPIGIIALLDFLHFQKFKKEYSLYEIISHVPAREAYHSKGTLGELKCFCQLNTIEIYHKILANIYLPSNQGGTTEIDLLYICTSGIYIIESKNYSGWIFGTASQKNWTECMKGGKKFKFYNPIWQNEGHRKALMNILPDINPHFFYSFIVFSPDCELKKVNMKEPSITNIYLIKRQFLNMRMTEHAKQHPDILTNEQVDYIYQRLISYTNASVELKQQHIESVRRKQ